VVDRSGSDNRESQEPGPDQGMEQGRKRHQVRAHKRRRVSQAAPITVLSKAKAMRGEAGAGCFETVCMG